MNSDLMGGGHICIAPLSLSYLKVAIDVSLHYTVHFSGKLGWGQLRFSKIFLSRRRPRLMLSRTEVISQPSTLAISALFMWRKNLA